MESIDFRAGRWAWWFPILSELRKAIFASGCLRVRTSHSRRWRLKAPIALGRANRFTIVMCLEGAAMVEQAGKEPRTGSRLTFGQTLLLPATAGARTANALTRMRFCSLAWCHDVDDKLERSRRRSEMATEPTGQESIPTHPVRPHWHLFPQAVRSAFDYRKLLFAVLGLIFLLAGCAGVVFSRTRGP